MPAPTRFVALSLLALSAGCDRGSTRSPAPTPTLQASATVAPAAVAPLDWLGQVDRGEVAAAQAFDAKKGVPFVEYYEDLSGEDPRRDSEGVVKTGTLLCDGQTLVAKIQQAFVQGKTLGPITCEDGPSPACTFQGMEGTPAIHVSLRRAAARLEIAAVTRVSDDGTMAPAWIAEARAWANGRQKELEATTCP